MKFSTLFAGFFVAAMASDIADELNSGTGIGYQGGGNGPEDFETWRKGPEAEALRERLRNDPYPTIPMIPKP